MRVLLALAAGLATVAALAGPNTERAFACSCAAVDPARDLPQADAAFVGRAVSQTLPKSIRRSTEPAFWTFEVERAVKGMLPARLEVTTAVSGASCGLELRLDQRVGLLLQRRGDGYASSLCWQVDPELLARHALPTAEVAGPVPEPGDDGRPWPAIGSGLALGLALAAAIALGLRRRNM